MVLREKCLQMCGHLCRRLQLLLEGSAVAQLLVLTSVHPTSIQTYSSTSDEFDHQVKMTTHVASEDSISENSRMFETS